MSSSPSKTAKWPLLFNDQELTNIQKNYESIDSSSVERPKWHKSRFCFQFAIMVMLCTIALCSITALIFSILVYKSVTTEQQKLPINDGISRNSRLAEYLSLRTSNTAYKKSEQMPKKPNFFIFLVDDLGFGDLASYGHPTQEWGPIDELARSSMKFKQFYVDALCTPTRAQLLTGRMAVRLGMSGGSNGRVFTPNEPGGLPDDEITIPELLKPAGYVSGINGKWHLGINCKTSTDGCHLPFNHGFNFVGTYYPFTNNMNCDEEQKYYQQPSKQCFLYRGRQTSPWQQPVYHENLTQTLVMETKEFLTKNRDNPWFYYFATPQIHKNLFSSKMFKGSSKRGPIGDAINELNWSVGEILKHLHNLDLADNTLFLFLSDNGGSQEDCEEGGNNGALRAGKGMTWEGGIRAHAMAYWPGRISPGVSDAILIVADIFPTLANLAALSVPEDRTFDGKDMSQVMFGDGSQSEQDFNRPHFFYCSDKLMAMRQGPYKLHYWTWLWTFDEASKQCVNGNPPFSTNPLTPAHFYWAICNETRMEHHDPPLLYNLERDPSEQYPLRPEDFQTVIHQATAAVELHKKTLSFGRIINQMDLKTDIKLVPCCHERGRTPCICNYPFSDKFGF